MIKSISKAGGALDKLGKLFTRTAPTVQAAAKSSGASVDTMGTKMAAAGEAATAAGAEVETAEEGVAATSEATGEASSAAFGPIGIAMMALVTVGMLVVTHWKAIAHAIVDAFHAVVDFFEDFPSKIMGFFSSAGQWLVKASQDILKGLITGFEYLTPEDLVIKFHKQILDGLKDAGTWLLDIGNQGLLKKGISNTMLFGGNA
jgi:hypothetical protein